MNIGYIRVSTIEQNTERQQEGLNGYDIDKWYIERISGKDIINRPQLKEMLDFCREGDTVFVLDFSRLSRSVKDLLNIIDQLQVKSVHLRSIKENLDTSTPTGKLMMMMIAAINEFERANLLERQKEGILIAKRNKDKYKGRSRIKYPDNWQELYAQWISRELKSIEFMERAGLKKATFYNLLKQYKIKQNNIL